MQQHWAASAFLYVLVIHIVWRIFDELATCLCKKKSGCYYSWLSPYFQMLFFSIALVICVGDSVGFCHKFHLYDPQYFFQNYSNGTAFGPEWETQLVFPPGSGGLLFSAPSHWSV